MDKGLEQSFDCSPYISPKKIYEWSISTSKDAQISRPFVLSCSVVYDSIDCSPPDSSVQGISQARILEQVAISHSRGSSWPRDRTWVFASPALLFRPSVSLLPPGLQHTRLPCPSSSPRACSKSCPLSQWCHPTISSSVISFSSCLQSFPGSGSFPMSQLFASGGQSIGALVSASVLPFQGWFLSGLTGLVSLHWQADSLPLWHSGNSTQLLPSSHPRISCDHRLIPPLWGWKS